MTRVVFVLAPILACLMTMANVTAKAQENTRREYYEVRIYQIFDYEKQVLMQDYLRDIYLPALNRAGIDRVGVFTDMKDENSHSVFMVIPFQSPQQFADLRDTLNQDPVYVKGEKSFSSGAAEDPVFSRVESRFLKSFADMPVMELPDYSVNRTARIFELRLYESPADDHARRKVKMFNEGELQLMRDVNLAPVFFGETLIGPSVPNLIYLLSAESEAAHKEHWQAFLNDPRWPEMRDLPEYKDTVSNIRSWFLKPLDFSGF